MEPKGVDMKGKFTLSRLLRAFRHIDLKIFHIHLEDPKRENYEFLQQICDYAVHHQPKNVGRILYSKNAHPNANLLSNSPEEHFPRF